jgi:hypothetical protein
MAKIVKNGIIYLLMSELGGVAYYGSSGQKASQRLAEHRRDYKKFLANKAKFNLTSCIVMKYPDYKMIILDEYQNITREQLEINEGYYIANNVCVNKNIAGSTVDPHYTKKYCKAYNDAKREKKLKELNKIEL